MSDEKTKDGTIVVSSGGLNPSNVGENKFPNLARHERLFVDRADAVDIKIRHELFEAGIDIMDAVDPINEPMSLVYGAIKGKALFERAWYYYVVTCKLPLIEAEKIYATEIGKLEVRVAGHCACPPPADWAEYYDDTGRRVLGRKDEHDFRTVAESDGALTHIGKAGLKNYRFEDDLKQFNGFVTLYHVDSQDGLNMLAAVIKSLPAEEPKDGEKERGDEGEVKG